ncbi:hypothetical protein [uncultured Sulfitobacter sp.]|uniref:hypothetical protein n=1 Tax=uncultured Sulfitobacter sp. TaxID=191468 RepID=UPI0026208DC2|nr:hypothetical protein [uncultured Sulfitobacter sp.]
MFALVWAIGFGPFGNAVVRCGDDLAGGGVIAQAVEVAQALIAYATEMMEWARWGLPSLPTPTIVGAGRAGADGLGDPFRADGAFPCVADLYRCLN